MSRVTGKVLLLGSVPFDTAEQVFRTCAECVGDLVTGLPDGEVGYRAQWINFLAAKVYCEHPSLETVRRPKTAAGESGWAPREYGDNWLFKVKKGVKSLRFEDLGYAREAEQSYATFRALREGNVIPPGTRFQVSLPPIESGTRQFVTTAQDFEIMWDGYEEAMGREIAAICKHIPANDLLIQWDICVEVLAIATGDQRQGSSPWEAPGDPFDRYLRAIKVLAPCVPDDVPMGLHLCYGDLSHRHLVEPQDLGLVVRIANETVAEVERRIDYVHVPVPRDRYDRSYFQPLKDLAIGDAKLYVGLVHHTGGVDGALKRLATARRYAAGFGIATECGLGRRLPETIPELLRILRTVAGTLD